MFLNSFPGKTLNIVRVVFRNFTSAVELYNKFLKKLSKKLIQKVKFQWDNLKRQLKVKIVKLARSVADFLAVAIDKRNMGENF